MLRGHGRDPQVREVLDCSSLSIFIATVIVSGLDFQAIGQLDLRDIAIVVAEQGFLYIHGVGLLSHVNGDMEGI